MCSDLFPRHPVRPTKLAAQRPISVWFVGGPGGTRTPDAWLMTNKYYHLYFKKLQDLPIILLHCISLHIMVVVLCPRSFCTLYKSTPAITSREANV